jgi:hypothetical protein
MCHVDVMMTQISGICMLEFYFVFEFIHFIVLRLSIVGGVFWFGCGGLSCILFIPKPTCIGGATHQRKKKKNLRMDFKKLITKLENDKLAFVLLCVLLRLMVCEINVHYNQTTMFLCFTTQGI